jgi:hypothetical protein
LGLDRQVLIDERLNPRGVRIHQQRFGGGRGLRLVNLLGGFDCTLYLPLAISCRTLASAPALRAAPEDGRFFSNLCDT